MATTIKVKIDTKELERLKTQVEKTKLKIEAPEIKNTTFFNPNTLNAVSQSIKTISTATFALGLAVKTMPSLKEKLGISDKDLIALANGFYALDTAIKVIRSSVNLLGLSFAPLALKIGAIGITLSKFVSYYNSTGKEIRELASNITTSNKNIVNSFISSQSPIEIAVKNIGNSIRSLWSSVVKFSKSLLGIESEYLKIAKLYKEQGLLKGDEELASKYLEKLNEVENKIKVIKSIAKDSNDKATILALDKLEKEAQGFKKLLLGLGIVYGEYKEKVLKIKEDEVKVKKEDQEVNLIQSIIRQAEARISQKEYIIETYKSFLKDNKGFIKVLDTVNKNFNFLLSSNLEELEKQRLSLALKLAKAEMGLRDAIKNNLPIETITDIRNNIAQLTELQVQISNLFSKINDTNEKLKLKWDKAFIDKFGLDIANSVYKFTSFIEKWESELNNVSQAVNNLISGDIKQSFSNIISGIQSSLKTIAKDLKESGDVIVANIASSGSFIIGAVFSVITGIMDRISKEAERERERKKAILEIRKKWERDELKNTLDKEIEIRRKHLSALERNLNIYEDAFKRGIIGIDAYTRELKKVSKVKDELKDKEDEKKGIDRLNELLKQVADRISKDNAGVDVNYKRLFKEINEFETTGKRGFQFFGSFYKKMLEFIFKEELPKNMKQELKDLVKKYGKKMGLDEISLFKAPTSSPIFSPMPSPSAPIININVNGIFDLTNPLSIKKFTDTILRELRVRKLEGNLNI